MPTQVQFRRGTTAQNGNFTGAAGEISIDTDKKTVVVHDGSTAGGFPLAPNSAFNVANAAFAAANNVAPQVTPAFNTANGAFDKANNALANTTNTVFQGNLTITGALTVGMNTTIINETSIIAQSLYIGNSTSYVAVSSGATTNAAYDVANASFDKANAANVLAYNTGIGANAYAAEVGTSANNYAGVMANAANAYAASLTPDLSPAFTRANTAYDVANAAFGQANTLKTSANAYADLVGTSANNYAGLMANASNTYAASLTPDLSPSFNVANAAFDKANAANVLAYNTGIGANAYVTEVGTAGNNYAGVMANSVNAYTSATYVKLSEPNGQTITGNLSVVGSLNITGNTSYIQVQNYRVDDPLIYLAANNYSGTDLIDIGFIANYGNSTGANVHTGLYREHTDKEWYLFQGYDAEPINNHIGTLSNNMTLSVLNADLRTSNLNLGGANAITWITSGFGVANAAYGQANTLATSANAYAAAVGVSANAYAVTVGTSGNAFATAVGTAGNAYAQTVGTSGNNYAATVGTSSNNYAGVMANSVNTYTSATYSTLTQLGQNWAVTNAAFGAANSKVASVTGTAGQIFSSGGTTPTLNLISSGVTAATYGGGGTQVPVVTVDAFGRITSASNTTVNGMDYAYANTIWGVANGKVATVSSNSTSRIWANTVTVGTTKTVYVDLATSGVTATNYGGATQIPVLSIDAYGRVTSASNVAVSGMDYAYVNTSAGAANTYAASVGTSTNNYTSATYATKASPTFTGTVTTNANVSNQTLTDGVTINWDVSLGAVATVTLGGNRTIAAPTNLKIGTYILHVIQDATGSRTITWNSVFKWPAAVAPTLTTTGSRRDIISFVCDGTNLYGSFLPDVR